MSGDHGYRWDSLINPYKSMVFFKGFDKCNLKKVKYVQDIGSLIISSLDWYFLIVVFKKITLHNNICTNL